MDFLTTLMITFYFLNQSFTLDMRATFLMYHLLLVLSDVFGAVYVTMTMKKTKCTCCCQLEPTE